MSGNGSPNQPGGIQPDVASPMDITEETAQATPQGVHRRGALAFTIGACVRFWCRQEPSEVFVADVVENARVAILSEPIHQEREMPAILKTCVFAPSVRCELNLEAIDGGLDSHG
jgi:hypothetical protein